MLALPSYGFNEILESHLFYAPPLKRRGKTSPQYDELVKDNQIKYR
jgi:hypothetical protein